MRISLATSFAILLMLFSSPVSADLLTVVNPSFEDDVLAEGQFASFANGWSSFGDAGTYNPTIEDYPGGVPDGQNVGFVSAFGPTIGQVLVDVLEADTLYELSMWVGNRVGSSFPAYSIQLLAGGTVIAEDLNSLAPGDGEFLQSSLSYFASDTDPLLGQTLEIRMGSFGVPANFDDVQLSATSIPEPAFISGIDGTPTKTTIL